MDVCEWTSLTQMCLHCQKQSRWDVAHWRHLINGLFSGHPNLCRGLKGPCLSRGVCWDICVETEREGGERLHRTVPRLCLDYSLKTEITPQYEGGVDQSHIQGKNLICKFKSNTLLLMWMALWVCAALCTWSFICRASTKPISDVQNRILLSSGI